MCDRLFASFRVFSRLFGQEASRRLRNSKTPAAAPGRSMGSTGAGAGGGDLGSEIFVLSARQAGNLVHIDEAQREAVAQPGP